MTLNAYFDNVLVYNVQDQLMIVKGEKFALNFSETTGPAEVFSNNDKVLAINHSGDWVDIEALENGISVLRFMVGTTIVKDLIIEIVDSITRPATTLNGSLGEPVNK